MGGESSVAPPVRAALSAEVGLAGGVCNVRVAIGLHGHSRSVLGCGGSTPPLLFRFSPLAKQQPYRSRCFQGGVESVSRRTLQDASHMFMHRGKREGHRPGAIHPQRIFAAQSPAPREKTSRKKERGSRVRTLPRHKGTHCCRAYRQESSSSETTRERCWGCCSRTRAGKLSRSCSCSRSRTGLPTKKGQPPSTRQKTQSRKG